MCITWNLLSTLVKIFIFQPVGFTATMPGDTEVEGPSTTRVKFQTVQTNAGGHFQNQSTFVCPYDGLYEFSLRVGAFEKTAHAAIHKNGEEIELQYLVSCRAVGSRGRYASSTASIVVECQNGEEVYVLPRSSGILIGSTSRSYFSGHLIARNVTEN